MKKISFVFIFTLTILMLISCNKKNESNDFLTKANEVLINNDIITFEDASNTRHTLHKNYSNVISLYSSYTTLWYEAGGKVMATIGGETAVELYLEYIGRDITEEVSVISTSSNPARWSVEKIVGLNPDLIICSKAMNAYEVMKGPASNLGVPLIVVDYENLADYLKWFKVFSFLTDNSDLYEHVALKTLNEVNQIIEKTKQEKSVLTLPLFAGPESVQINTKNTLIGSMIEDLGSENIASSLSSNISATRIPLNLEALYIKQPQKIIIACHVANDLASDYVTSALGDKPLWQNLDAVKNNEVYYLPKVLFHNKPNHRFSESYLVLAKTIYPNIEF